MKIKWCLNPLHPQTRVEDDNPSDNISRWKVPDLPMPSGQTCRERGAMRLVMVLALMTACGALASGSTPDWLRSAAQAALPKYPEDTKAVILFSQQVTTVTNDGDIKTHYREAVKILRPQGRDLGYVAVPFDKDTRLTYLKGWCIPQSGKDYEVKEKDALETGYTADMLYDDAKTKVIKIPASEPGSVIGYEYERRRRPFMLQDTWEFQAKLPVHLARFELHLPPNWEFDSFWLNHAAQKPSAIGNGVWEWQLEDVPAIQDELNMPAWRGLAGRLGISYFAPNGASGEQRAASWQDVGRWYAHLSAESRQPSPEITQKVSELTAQAKTPLEKIHALATFVQRDIRYVAIEIGIGGFRPHQAQDIFSNHYGDCKDKATLLGTMLKQAGISSYYVLINVERGIVTPDFPTAEEFNHVILAIQIPPETDAAGLYGVTTDPKLGCLLFFDPSDPYTPLGYLPPALEANYGLLVTDDGGQLVKLPLLPPSLNRLFRSAKLLLGADGNLFGDVTEIRWGAQADIFRGRLLSLPDAQRRKATEDFLSSFMGGFTLLSYKVDGLENLDSNTVLLYRLSADAYAQTAGDLLLVRPRVLGSKEEMSFDNKDRQYPIAFAAPTLQSDVVDIQIPNGYQLDGLPGPVNLDTGVASYKSKVELNGDTLHYTRVYEVKDVLVPKDRLAALKNFYHQIAVNENMSAILKKKPQP
ncbi:MAG TPA: DUF3857 and transglutaminase domain-containing protein [Terriglobia bacterium]|nr:DUF3857 and transglutaminase domain-containing protein [Terriglobia bacterium]